MKINLLELKNIRSYNEETISFPEGSILLSGDVGHGKSSLLLAIEFALFGIRRGELTGDELLRGGKKSGSVKLDFTINGKNYIITRTLKRTETSVIQDSGYIITDEVREDLQAGELKSRIFEILGYSKELITKQKSYIYRFTVYTPQEEMKKIILADEERRLETLRRVFGINKYKRIRDNISSIGVHLRGYKRELIGRAEGLDEKIDDLKKLKSELEELEEKYKEAEKAGDEINKKLEEKEEIWDKIREELNEFNRLKTNKIKIETKIEGEEKTLRGITDNIENIQRKIKDLEKLKKPTDMTEGELEDKIDEIEIEKERYLKERKGLKPEIDNLIKKEEEKQKKIEKVGEEVNKCKGIITQLKKSIEELKQAGDVCPVCGSKLTEAHKEREIEKNNGKIGELEKKIEGLTKGKRENEEEIKILENTIKEEIRRLLEEIKEKIESLKKLAKEIREYNQSMKKKEEYKKDIKDKEKKKEEVIVLIEGFKKQLDDLILHMKKYEGIEGKEKEIREKLEKVHTELTDAKSKVTELKTKVKNKQEIMTGLEGEITKKEKSKNLAARLSMYEAWLGEYLSKLTSIIERHFMFHLQKKFNSVFGKWFNSLVEEENLAVHVNDRFTPVIERDGYEVKYGYLSGGEKTSVALAYRLALNTVLNSLVEEIKTKDLIILDEPTDGFSTNQLDKVRDVINELGMKQTILVSHEPKIEGYVDNVIYIRKENGISRIFY